MNWRIPSISSCSPNGPHWLPAAIPRTGPAQARAEGQRCRSDLQCSRSSALGLRRCIEEGRFVAESRQGSPRVGNRRDVEPEKSDFAERFLSQGAAGTPAPKRLPGRRAAGSWGRGHDSHRRHRARCEGPRQADRLLDASGENPTQQADREAQSPIPGSGAIARHRRPGLRRLGYSGP